MLENHFAKIVESINNGDSDAALSNWVLSNLKVFQKKYLVSDTIAIQINDDREEDVEDGSVQQLYCEAEKVYMEDIKEENRITDLITAEMKTTHKVIWKVFDFITAKAGACGLFGGVDGTPGDRIIMFFMAHIMDKLRPGALGLDIGHGNGGTALSFACSGGLRMIGVEVTTFY